MSQPRLCCEKGLDIVLQKPKGRSDPIASILFVLAIEILLIAIRNNPKIEPYRYETTNVYDKPNTNKVGAYADDVNIMMPRSESSIKETVSTLDRFEKLLAYVLTKTRPKC